MFVNYFDVYYEGVVVNYYDVELISKLTDDRTVTLSYCCIKNKHSYNSLQFLHCA